MLTSNDLERFIAAQNIAATLVWPGVPTPTVVDAAAALGVAPAQIIKSVLFVADGEPVLVVASGQAKISSKLLADHLGLARRRVRVALGEKVTAVTGYIPGSVPPFGHLQPLATVLEAEVLALTGDIYGGGGDLDALLRLSLAELRRVVGEKTAVLVE
ncbi:MAG: hypothetical protein KDE56_12875 [Anaerolineales bacterium]|nr:hypothetical protein [Anaerolineales bacterium]